MKQTIQQKPQQEPETARPNLTGIPTQMKQDFEARSGLSFDDVRVHYNSDKPAQLQALAYTQGTQVHVGPGQERHLPHELGHVVQQKRGLVTKTTTKNSIAINDENRLEAEADHLVMASKKSSTVALVPNIVQKKGTLHDIDPKSETFIDDVLVLMDMGGSNILDQYMDLIKNDGKPDHKKNGTIRQYIETLLQELPTVSKYSIIGKSMKIGAVVKGIARGLATRTGDLAATNRIARALMHNLDEYKNDPTNTSPLFQVVDSFGRSNPILKYLHREINANDAAVLVQRRANRAGLSFDDMFSLLEQEAWAEIKSLSDDMLASEPDSFEIGNTPGLYSKSFRDKIIDPYCFFWSDWSKYASKKIGKISKEIHKSDFRLPTALGKPYAIVKAEHHDRKMDLPENYDKLGLILKKIAPDEKINCEEFVQKMINKLKGSNITITRFASSLVQNEMKEDKGPYFLRPGTPTAYTSLDEIKKAQNLSVYAPLKSDAKKEKDTPLSFTPLLSAEAEERKARNSTYPLFRSYKDSLYKGKLWRKGGQQQIFGALNFGTDSNRYGYKSGGLTQGLYGDVTFVLSNSIKNSRKVVYTNTCDGKSFTSLEKFVYALLQKQTDIYGNDLKDDQVLSALCAAILGKRDIGNALHLEVQIFGDLELTEENIEKVVFAASVSKKQREEIMQKIVKEKSTIGFSTSSIKFYQYDLPTLSEPSQNLIDCLRFHPPGTNESVPVAMNVFLSYCKAGALSDDTLKGIVSWPDEKNEGIQSLIQVINFNKENLDAVVKMQEIRSAT